MNKLLYLLLSFVVCSCAHDSMTEKYQNTRNKIVDIHDKVKEFKIDSVQVNGNSSLYLINQYLIIGDYRSADNIIHILDKNDFRYITSTGYLGQGPGEISNMGYIGINEAKHEFYVTDHGKQKIFGYQLDSILVNPSYVPFVKTTMNNVQFPTKYNYVNDTLCIGLFIEPIGNNNFKPSVAKWNINTKNVTLMKYSHPDIEKKRIYFAASIERNLYVECYTYHDLITFCNLEGELLFNIYGPHWNSNTKHKIHYFDDILFCKDKIVASYSGGDNLTDDYYATKFIVFDLNGEYIKTLDVGYMIFNFCYDKDNDRIIMSLNDEMQFAYLDMKDLI